MTHKPYFKKSHSHKPKKGKGSYDRGDQMSEWDDRGDDGYTWELAKDRVFLKIGYYELDFVNFTSGWEVEFTIDGDDYENPGYIPANIVELAYHKLKELEEEKESCIPS